MEVIAGIDIGGTKCAVTLIRYQEGSVEFLFKRKRETYKSGPDGHIRWFIDMIREALSAQRDWELAAVGISCGGPLDEERGLILGPPNLPGWDYVDLFTPLKGAFPGIPVTLQNDANACALAEWQLGAGKGCRNMIFLTFGTGLGAGLILNGDLYSGTNGMAGEVGHIRLCPTGPVGYGKEGSFEGFCSGGGIAQLGRTAAREAILRGEPVPFAEDEAMADSVSAKTLGEAAAAGNPTAREIFCRAGRELGRGLAVLVDILNPEKIIIGSIYLRQRELLEESMREALKEEALPQSMAVVEILPAGLGEKLGDYAAVSVGIRAVKKRKEERQNGRA